MKANIYNEKACSSSFISDGLLYIRKAVGIDDNPLLWFNQGILLSRTDSIFMSSFLDDSIESIELDASMRCFDKAIKLSENEWVFKLNYSLSLWLTDSINRKRAINILKDAMMKHDVGCELIGVLGIMEEKEGDNEDALKQYSQLIIKRPSVVGSPFYKELKLRNNEIADEALDSAINFYSNNMKNNPIIMAKLGSLLIEKGRYGEAQELLYKAVTEMPTLNRAWYYLGLLAEQKGQKQESKQMFIKSLKLDRGDLLVMQKVASFDPSYKSENEIIKRAKKDETVVALSNRYAATTIKEPYLLVGLVDYFTPTN